MLDDEPARGLRQGADPAGPRALIGAEPANRLPEAAKAFWRTVGAMVAVPVVVVAVATLGPLGLIALPFAAAAVAVVPVVRWRRWRYEVRDDEIDLQHGLWSVKRTVVPIRRVQHVDTSVGALQGSFGLATVTFHTAAGETAIPAVGRAEAEVVRNRVAELARTRDDV